MAERVTITRLGTAGDGVALGESGPLYVPYALPGEEVTVERQGNRAALVSRETDAPERVAPFCPYFGACGGCVAQHMGEGLYRDWKRESVVGALSAARIAVETDALIDAHGEGRRRITFHARFCDGVPRIGFMAPRSHDLIEIAVCPVTEPRLAGAPEAARAIARRLSGRGKPLDIQVTATSAGLDIDLRGHGPLDARETQVLIAEAARLDLSRLSNHGDVLIENRPPRVPMGRAEVRVPPGGFLQATRAGEQALADLVVAAAGRSRRIVDLYAGCGPFALRLAEHAEIRACEQDAASLAALDRAARETPGLRRIAIEERDLYRRPLLSTELAAFDAAIVNPPRSGAEAQSRQLVASTVPLVVMVSCDPGTFARDAAILIGGGYALERVTPVDQFKYSAHVEVVGIFRRAVAKRRRM